MTVRLPPGFASFASVVSKSKRLLEEGDNHQLFDFIHEITFRHAQVSSWSPGRSAAAESGVPATVQGVCYRLGALLNHCRIKASQAMI